MASPATLGTLLTPPVKRKLQFTTINGLTSPPPATTETDEDRRRRETLEVIDKRIIRMQRSVDKANKLVRTTRVKAKTTPKKTQARTNALRAVYEAEEEATDKATALLDLHKQRTALQALPSPYSQTTTPPHTHAAPSRYTPTPPTLPALTLHGSLSKEAITKYWLDLEHARAGARWKEFDADGTNRWLTDMLALVKNTTVFDKAFLKELAQRVPPATWEVAKHEMTERFARRKDPLEAARTFCTLTNAKEGTSDPEQRDVLLYSEEFQQNLYLMLPPTTTQDQLDYLDSLPIFTHLYLQGLPTAFRARLINDVRQEVTPSQWRDQSQLAISLQESINKGEFYVTNTSQQQHKRKAGPGVDLTDESPYSRKQKKVKAHGVNTSEANPKTLCPRCRKHGHPTSDCRSRYDVDGQLIAGDPPHPDQNRWQLLEACRFCQSNKHRPHVCTSQAKRDWDARAPSGPPSREAKLQRTIQKAKTRIAALQAKREASAAAAASKSASPTLKCLLCQSSKHSAEHCHLNTGNAGSPGEEGGDASS